MDGGSIVKKAFQQPAWWGGWYPRAFRRRGDLWDRVPRELRAFRAYRAAFLVYVFGAFLPVQLVGLAYRNALASRGALYVLTAALIGGLVFVRRRATARIKSALAVTDADASRLLNTPTWRTSVWRKPSTASLLASQAATPAIVGEDRLAAPDEPATRVSSRY
jgi:hypothetical protein